jgi:hypothetical protein
MYCYFKSTIIVVKFKYFYGSMTYTHKLEDSLILTRYIFIFCHTNATLKKLDRHISPKTFTQQYVSVFR